MKTVEAPCSRQRRDDDIVHAIWKQVDKCNQLVAGSNPAPGAKQKYPDLPGYFYFYCFINQCLILYSV